MKPGRVDLCATTCLQRSRQPRGHQKATDALPSVVVAPGLLGRQHEVNREDDDTDAGYQARQELFALLILAAATH